MRLDDPVGRLPARSRLMVDARVPHDHRFRSGPPARAARVLPPVPRALAGMLSGAPAVQIWVKRESEVWRIELATGPAYLKIIDDLDPWAEEVARLRWCADHSPLPTPHVLADAVDEQGRGWFLATEVAGTPSHDPRWAFAATALVEGLAGGLRRLHEGSSVDAVRSTLACPFRMTVDDLLARAEARVGSGGVDPSGMRSATYQRRSAEQLLDHLVASRPDEPAADQVVTHGDPCQPNLLMAPTSGGGVELVGLVDLGRLAVTDRHRDLAITARSLGVNLGAAAAAAFLACYGVDPSDRHRLEWWTLADDMW